jgi:hypothetical protein
MNLAELNSVAKGSKISGAKHKKDRKNYVVPEKYWAEFFLGQTKALIVKKTCRLMYCLLPDLGLSYRAPKF